MAQRVDRVSTTRWLVAVLILSNLIFATAQVLSQVRLRQLAQQVAETRDRLSRAELDRSHLFHRVASIPLEGEFLAGTDSLTQEKITIADPPAFGVYYLMDSSCAICPRNYEFLDDLARQGAVVIGLSPKDEMQSLREHVGTYGLSMPVLHQPTGALMRAIPQFGTPLTTVYRGAELVYLSGGVLDAEEQEAVRRIVSAQHP